MPLHTQGTADLPPLRTWGAREAPLEAFPCFLPFFTGTPMPSGCPATVMNVRLKVGTKTLGCVEPFAHEPRLKRIN